MRGPNTVRDRDECVSIFNIRECECALLFPAPECKSGISVAHLEEWSKEVLTLEAQFVKLGAAFKLPMTPAQRVKRPRYEGALAASPMTSYLLLLTTVFSSTVFLLPGYLRYCSSSRNLFSCRHRHKILLNNNKNALVVLSVIINRFNYAHKKERHVCTNC